MNRNRLISLITATALSATVTLNTFAANDFTPTQTKAVEKIVHDYLVTNPEVLIEAGKALRAKEQKKASKKAQAAIKKNLKSIFNSPDSPTFGNKDGDVTIVEFLDYQCAHCKTMGPVVFDVLKQDNKLRFVVKELPIFGGTSNYAARAAIAAHKQDPKKFETFHKDLLAAPSKLSNDKVIAIAKKAGLDTDQLKKDIESKEVKAQITDNFRLAQELGLMGTPAFIISNRDGTKTEYMPGAITKERLTKTIKSARNG